MGKSQLLQTDPREALHHDVHKKRRIDAQCDKLAKVVGQTKQTTLAAIDAPRRILVSDS